MNRIGRDEKALPPRLLPFAQTEASDAPRHSVIDSEVGFGRPIVRRRGVSTEVLVDRVDGGEWPEAVAEDHGLQLQELEEAVVYEPVV